ncbi:hypothetical protein SPF06_04320 [Sinomonas sp. JGH33]|uniref:DNA mimic protein DMP19 C-terminal domain-containing protein n=1 Tax=Sinomonas terricola TaxID=3110330 RepID=A0ABU5T396_9MICC|nr:hypothetical protein [Sinomonas sp. JGH33]MEA5453941.1 hypothetical protein [Sinomonas sp. JGH33]
MSTNQHPVVLPAEVLEGPDDEVVDANIDVVNAMYSELLGEDEIAVNALRSYYVDFYFTEALDGGFAQYAVSAGDREEIDGYVRDGLREMGAAQHLELFDAIAAAYDALDDDEEETYLVGDGKPTDAVKAVEELDERFEEILAVEDLVALNAAWLRGQEGLLALDDDGIEDEIARRVGLIPDLEERRAEAAALDEELEHEGAFDDAYDDDDFEDLEESDDDASPAAHAAGHASHAAGQARGEAAK